MLLGAHCSGGIRGALDRAVEIGADSVQLFTQSPRTWRAPAPTRRTRRSANGAPRRGIFVLCHALYLCNLAAPDDTVYEKSVATLSATVDTACAIEAEGVVFHVGSHSAQVSTPGWTASRPRCGPSSTLLDTTWLLMENSAGAGGTIGRSIEELTILHERLDAHPRLGICLDSCHLYVSGYDVTDAAALDAVLEELDDRIGLDRLRALHVNDAKTPLGSNSDRHDNVLDGLMGEKLGVFLGHPKLQGLPRCSRYRGRTARARTPSR